MLTVDIALLGGGGAAHCLLHALADAGADLTVAVLDPVRHNGNDRTWCFWDGGTSPVEAAVSRRWSALRVVGPDGVGHRLAPCSYAMVRSADFYRLARERCAGVRWLPARVRSVRQDGRSVRIDTDTGGTVTARWAFDSRPRPPDRPGGTSWLQHFRGRWLRDAGLDTDIPTLMDFTAPQPANGLAFGYLLPAGDGQGLVEYTVFSAARLPDADYDAALDRLCDGLSGTVESIEDGVIPMTDGRFARRVGPRLFRLGTAGGATRPATGYTFGTMLRQAGVVAGRLAAGVEPVPPRPYPERHRRYDAILLRALDRRLVDGPRLLTDLLTTHPTERILAFLDGTSTRRDEARILASTPIPAMLRAALGAR